MTKNWMDDLVGASTVARHIAYAGELEFAGCTEDDRTGRTVTFLLRRRPEDLLKAHPFSPHTRRRRGHAGTQFEVSLELFSGSGPSGMQPMMLLNWGASPKGETVKFLLTFDAEKHPFLGCQRAAKDEEPTRWMAAFIEVDDQSQAVDQVQREKIEAVTSHRGICLECNQRVEPTGAHLASCSAVAPRRKPKQQIRNSNLAAQFIKNERFWKYLHEEHGYETTSQQEADVALKQLLHIDSKAQLDDASYPSIANNFHMLREAFVKWQSDTFGPEALQD